MNSNYVILVDENDRKLGVMEKQEAHLKGFLHRAFSIFILNKKGELLLQKRAKDKYHSGGLWTNTCCSHPQPRESLEDATRRRLKEEMGFSCRLEKAFSFTYKSKVDNGLTEHEFDHVFIGRHDEHPKANPLEVMDWKWASLPSIEKELEDQPEKYTSWMKLVFGRVQNYLRNSNDFIAGSSSMGK